MNPYRYKYLLPNDIKNIENILSYCFQINSKINSSNELDVYTNGFFTLKLIDKVYTGKDNLLNTDDKFAITIISKYTDYLNKLLLKKISVNLFPVLSNPEFKKSGEKNNYLLVSYIIFDEYIKDSNRIKPIGEIDFGINKYGIVFIDYRYRLYYSKY